MCRSFLTPYVDENGKPKYYGRFNAGVVTVSLPDIALSSGKNLEKFWEIMDERLELCHKALRVRYERLDQVTSDVAPILWQHGAFARLGKGESVSKLVHNGYATISLGYAGLYECVKYMTGKSHTDPLAEPFAIAVMQHLNDKCAEWKAAENISYSVYGTPIESTTYKFAKSLKRRFGEVPEVSDHDYITNSYHVCVRENISAFDKLKLEARLQKLSPGGAISYVEVPNMQNNIPAVLDIIKYIYDTIMYAELNTKSDFCMTCGFEGETLIGNVYDDDGTLVEAGKPVDKSRPSKLCFYCPQCYTIDNGTQIIFDENGNQTVKKLMNPQPLQVTRRTCGYIGVNLFNQGRTQEIQQRVLHVVIPSCDCRG